MHEEEIFQHVAGRPSIKSFAEVENHEAHGVGVSAVHLLVNKVEELDQIVAGGGAFQTTILARVEEGVNERQKPVTNNGLKDAA